MSRRKPAPIVAPLVESLEQRALLSAVLTGVPVFHLANLRSQILRPQVQAGVRFTSKPQATFETGALGSFTITTSISSGSIGESPSLPASLSLVENNNGTATITGTPADGIGGTYPLVLTAGSVTQDFTLIINQPPAITSDTSRAFAVGGTDTFGITTTGFPIAVVSEIGALPRGVRFKREPDGQAEIAGTPANKTGGTYLLTLTAKNNVGAGAVQDFVLTIDQSATITSLPEHVFAIGTATSFLIMTSGPPVASTITDNSATLPTGLSFTDNGDGTATIAGDPVGPVGTTQITLTANNGIGNPYNQTFLVEVGNTPIFTSLATDTFTDDVPGDFTITTTGFPAATFTERGDLPRGLHFRSDIDGTAHLYGTPAGGTGGTYPLTFIADNGLTPTPQDFTLSVDQAPSFTSPTHLHIVSGVPYTFNFTTAGFPAASLSESGALPANLTFSPNSNGTASLLGPLSQGTSGTYILFLTASNGVSSASQKFTLTVN